MQQLEVSGAVRHIYIYIYVIGRLKVNKLLIKFILLLGIITFWYNTPLQVLTKAPALHSLIIRDRNKDVDEILDFLFKKPVDLKRLIFECWWLGERTNLDVIVGFYPDLEGLSLEGCYSLSPDDYRHITRLKKISELKLRDCEVDYVCFKLLHTNVCLREPM